MSFNERRSHSHSPELLEIPRIVASPTVYDLSDGSPSEQSSRVKCNSSLEQDWRLNQSRSLERDSRVRRSTSSERNRRIRRSTSSQRNRRIRRSTSSERNRRERSTSSERHRRVRRSTSPQRNCRVRHSTSSERNMRVRRSSPTERDRRIRQSTSSDRDRRAKWNTKKEPPFCFYSLRRRCLLLRYGKPCNDIHLDDESSKHRDSDSGDGGEAGQGHDDDDNDDDDDDDDDDRRRQRKKRERAWRNEKAPRDTPPRSSSVEKLVFDEVIKGDYYDARLRPVERLIRNSQKVKPVCKLHELGLCVNGKHCAGSHVYQDSKKTDKGTEKVCVYFVRGLCKRSNCKFAHPETDLRKVLKRQVWPKVCKKYQHHLCDDSDCSYLHITSEDEELYKKRGLISELVLGQAIRDVLRLDIPIDGSYPTCKDKLNGDCNILNCPFLHVTREEFMVKVLDRVKAEFMKIYGESQCIFNPTEAQAKIVHRLLNPEASIAPVTAASTAPVIPNGPSPFPPYMAPVPMCPPTPVLNPMLHGMQPAATGTVPPPSLQPREDEDIDKVLAKKLEFANEKLIEENEKFAKYVETLEKENYEIKRILDPEQPAADLDDIRNRIMVVFENIYWKNGQKLMEKSIDYGHRKSEKKPTEQNEASAHSPQMPLEIASGVPSGAKINVPPLPFIPPTMPQVPVGPYPAPPPQGPWGPYPAPFPQVPLGPYPPPLPQVPRGPYPPPLPQVPRGPYTAPPQFPQDSYLAPHPCNASYQQPPYLPTTTRYAPPKTESALVPPSFSFTPPNIGRSDSRNMPETATDSYNNGPSRNTPKSFREDYYDDEPSRNTPKIIGEDSCNNKPSRNTPEFNREDYYNNEPSRDTPKFIGEDNYEIEPMEMM